MNNQQNEKEHIPLHIRCPKDVLVNDAMNRLKKAEKQFNSAINNINKIIRSIKNDISI